MQTALEFRLQDMSPEQVRAVVQQTFPNQRVVTRSHFRLLDRFVGWMHSGKKSSTIRYVENGIDVPASRIFEILIDHGYHNQGRDSAGCMLIEEIVVKPFSALEVEDAQRDGFDSLKDLTDELRRIYGAKVERGLVTVYRGRLLADQGARH